MNQSGNSFLIRFYLGHVSDCVGVIHEFPLVHFYFPQPDNNELLSTKSFELKEVETVSVSCCVNSRLDITLTRRSPGGTSAGGCVPGSA